ncbi:MAG: glutamine amidotransferase family protein [Hyphomicrobiales bacterium]|nr:glutamine amidotransferase family protein [Hyphomicrobiales bacterium]
MCGIVGLFAKSQAMEAQLGAHLAQMLGVMCDRGPDSAGFAVYGAGRDGAVKVTVRGPEGYDFAALADAARAKVGAAVAVRPIATHAVFTVPESAAKAFAAFIAATPDVSVVSEGERIEVYKEVGLPPDVARRFGLAEMSGTHGIGHTRMATESAVTTNGAHPFTTGPDQCLVHNGSLSNHNAVRRALQREGFTFKTDNDSEVAAAYLSAQMRRGKSLGQALEAGLNDLDGFYTFVVGTESGFGVLRDPIACKPAVMAETEDYVAFGSEYRALAGLPGVGAARVWEPEPAKVYFWERRA